MRDILVERARRRISRTKREAGRAIDLGLFVDPLGAPDDELLALHDAMEVLRERDPRKHELVLLRFFGGLDFATIAELLGVSERTVERDWRFARAMLHETLTRGSEDVGSDG